jgi:ubiquinone/menaquinone biosynthesis C-methylase UbiE
MSLQHTYDTEFFDYINAGSSRSARRIVPLLVDMAAPRSVLDVGCGAGA